MIQLFDTSDDLIGDVLGECLSFPDDENLKIQEGGVFCEAFFVDTNKVTLLDKCRRCSLRCANHSVNFLRIKEYRLFAPAANNQVVVYVTIDLDRNDHCPEERFEYISSIL